MFCAEIRLLIVYTQSKPAEMCRQSVAWRSHPQRRGVGWLAVACRSWRMYWSVYTLIKRDRLTGKHVINEQMSNDLTYLLALGDNLRHVYDRQWAIGLASWGTEAREIGTEGDANHDARRVVWRKLGAHSLIDP